MAEPGSSSRGSRSESPLGAYSTLTALFGAGVLGVIAWSSSRGRLPRRVSARDTLLIGVATHKLARLIAKERVTQTIRAPFTEEKPVGLSPSKRVEVARGSGMRKAVGQLLTCPYCLAPWIAGGLLAAFTVSPPAARLVASLFSAVAVSDVATHAYQTLMKVERQAGSAAQPPEPTVIVPGEERPAAEPDIVVASE